MAILAMCYGNIDFGLLCSSPTLGRVTRVGEEHRNAARRRAWVLREDERREEASRVHWLANVRGRGVFRGRGNFVTNL